MTPHDDLLARIKEALRECVESCVEENREAAAERLMTVFRSLTAKLEAERRAHEKCQESHAQWSMRARAAETQAKIAKDSSEQYCTGYLAVSAKLKAAESRLAAVFKVIAKLPDTIRASTWKNPQLRESAAVLVTIILDELQRDESRALRAAIGEE